jgi:parallel beta-helix repeat protein
VISSSTGDAIACLDGSSAMITGNTLSGNTDGIFCDDSSPTISDCTLIGTDYTSGTGIECQHSSPAITGVAVMTFSYGVWFNFSSPSLTRSDISGNWQGVFGRGSAATITNCLIRGNVDGMQFDSASTPAIVNNTLVANSSIGIKCQLMDTPLIKNCILWDPGATELTNCSATYSDVLGGASGIGNVNADPAFANPTGGDFHLNPGSPCIDAGEDAVLQPAWTDRDGQPRRQGVHIDIGADESDGVAWPEGSCAVIRVSPDGDDANDGFSWPLAPCDNNLDFRLFTKILKAFFHAVPEGSCYLISFQSRTQQNDKINLLLSFIL